jgi:MraZ protein
LTLEIFFPYFGVPWGIVVKNTKEENLFKGQFKYSIDSKGRISIPAKLRKYVSSNANDTFTMTKGMGKCIDIYPLDQWQQFEEYLSKLNPFSQDDVKFIRMLLQHATEDNLDSQGRILIPQSLIEYAEIKNEVLILGALKKIEVWNPDIYKDYINHTKESYEELAAKVMLI